MSSQPNRVNTNSPFPTPSSSPGAVSLPPESEWSSTGSEWSLNASAQSSRAPTPLHPVSRCATPANPPTQEHLQMIGTLVWQLTGGRLPPLPPPPSNSPAEQPMSRPVTPAQQPKRKRVARPANAFMLYRSHLIKSGAIPKNIESRQQNISRIAGECWNLLSKEDKAYWHREAEKIQEIHKLKNPDYKFAPSRKIPKVKKASDGEDVPPQGHPDAIRYIREKYVGISGPAVPPPRPRKPKSRRNASAPPPAPDYQPNFSVPPGILPPSLVRSSCQVPSQCPTTPSR
ncbi:hypothetical protein C8Q74DRAFT_809449 [Fomes fomentarius]|nr:hypothetical protein C8Q74DRAFT_809449 [Fomes fomentarius]